MLEGEASQHHLLPGRPAECGSEAAILAVERNDVTGGLWSTEKYGDFLQGDKRMAFAFVTGRAEVQQLRGLYKIAFKDITIVHRRTAEDGSKSPLHAWVFLTKKKAKKRMADLEETGYVVPIPKNVGGYIGSTEATLGNFELTLRDAPEDPRVYKGLVIAKPAKEKPFTEEPVVFGYVRFIDDRPEIPATENTLGLNEYKDMLEKAQKHLLSTAGKPANKRWKSISYYRRMARKAWIELDKVEELEIEYDEFRRALDLLDVTMLEPRAIRIFEACDLDKSGRIGMTEFEIALMMHDGAPDSGLTPQDAFKMFDIENTGRITKTGFSRVVAALDVSKRLPGKLDSEERKRAIDALFDVIDEDKSGEITYPEFRNAWAQLVDVDFELRRRGAIPAKVPRFLRIFGFAQRATLALNRHTLLSACANEETAEQKAFEDTRQKVDELREKARRRRDERRRARAAEKDKLGMSSAKDTALRNKERAARLQREQAARSRHRQEEKVMKNRLEAEQAGAKRRRDAQIRAQSIQKEEDRIRDIRAAGLDRLDMSMHDHKEVPRELYSNAAARERLADIVYADLGDNRLEFLPAEGFLMWLASLRYLRLSNNRLVALPASEIGKMGKLEILHLNRNELAEFPNSMGHLSQLRELDASTNKLTNIPIGFERLNRLESLRLGSNNITELPGGLLGSLIKLRDLELRRNKLFELPGDFHEVMSLTRLDLHGNKLHKLPEQFGSLPRLRLLDLSSNNLVCLPESMCELKSCEIIHLQENQLHALGKYMGGWKRVAFVNASDNRIEYVDKAVGAMHRLNDIRLNRNKCVALPAEIGLASQLALFDASANAICQFPVELGAITLLHTVIMRRNSISGVMPEELGLLCSVTELDLSYNAIEALPATIAGLKEIVDLNLAHNRLETLPDSMSACQRLERLSVAANLVKTIPLFLCECRALRVLDLTSNVIAELPADLSRLTNITHIYLGKNRLRALPVEIVNLLDTVQEIHIDRNPLSELPPRWGRFVGNSAHDRARWPSGYDNESAVQWVRDHAKFYSEALAEWEATGPLHVSGRASLSAFESAVKKRCGGAWEECLKPFVRAYYFQARRTGNPPKFSHLSTAEVDIRKRTEMKANAIHAFRAARAKEEAALLSGIRQELYHGNLAERISTAETISAMRRERADVLQSNARAALIEQTRIRANVQERRETYLQSQHAAAELGELRALRQHLLDTYGEPADGSHFFPPINGF